MSRDDVAAPWHRASFEGFLNEGLPALLAERLPLAGYRVTPVDATTCSVTVVLGAAGGEVELVFDGIPQPDADGIFRIDGQATVVVPVAVGTDLARAEVLCVGEQLLAAIAARLGQAPPEVAVPWDAALARAWLPLDTWMSTLMAGEGDAPRVMAQRLDETNWLARATHLRRLIVQERASVIDPTEAGRVCPFETPEGPNLGRVLTIARGAEIRDGKLVVVDSRPEAGLGLSASLIPFIEHDDPNRILMGANMLRQWVPQARPEPALVQTGKEPAAAPVWTGRNLLTAFVAWGSGTYEDGIVVSASCAERFDTPYPLEVGDKMANRHGTKGVVSRILPDAAMPHLPDGTPVDLVYNFASLHTRMVFGQVREAVMGAIAHREGVAAIVPPFGAPGEDELRARLTEVGLPAAGMTTLTQGRDAAALAQPSTVGYVYWGRLVHLAQDKVRTFTAGEWGQVQGEMEAYMLRDVGAFENVREGLNTRAVRHPDADTLRARVAAGPVAQAEPPTPVFRDLVRRLRVGGIEAVLEGAALRLRFAAPVEGSLKLAHPVPHPWLHERALTEIGLPADDGWPAPEPAASAYAAVVEANHRVARMVTGQTPEAQTPEAQTPKRLVDAAVARLTAQVQAFFDALLTPAHLRLSERVLFSGRTVLVPAVDLALDQLGLPEEMAWDLFGPLAARALGGDEAAVAARNAAAAEALDAAMAGSWIVLNRAPTVTPTALLAFHPVRVPGAALQIHPLICEWLNADFDGDQAAVHVPVTTAAQQEAGERLTVAGHLRRDPGLLAGLLPRLDALWGLAALSRQPGGLDELAGLAGAPVAAARGFVTRGSLAEALQGVLAREGVETVLARLERLAARGFEVARASGASLAPFPAPGALVAAVPSDEGATPDVWDAHAAEVVEALAAPTDCAPASLGPQCLMARASGHGFAQLAWLIAWRGVVRDAAGNPVVVRHGYAEGYTAPELFAAVAGAREGFAQVIRQWEEMGRTFRSRNVAPSFHVLARALRSAHPGTVFARAAAVGEVDPLTDVEARLLVGLPVSEQEGIA